MQKELIAKNNELNQQLEEMGSKLEKSNMIIDEMKKQKEIDLAKKDATIADLTRKIEHILCCFIMAQVKNLTIQTYGNRI